MKIEQVPVQYVHAVWPDVERFLKKPVLYAHGEFTIEQLRAYVADGSWQLLVATEGATVHGAMVIHTFNRPNHRVAFVMAVGGRGIISRDTFTQLGDFARLWGAQRIECAARPAVGRLLERVGMQEQHRILGFSL